jgi:hypothetical protein
MAGYFGSSALIRALAWLKGHTGIFPNVPPVLVDCKTNHRMSETSHSCGVLSGKLGIS